MNCIGKGYYVRGSYDSSLIISNNALVESEALADTLGTGMAMNNIGLVYLAHDDCKAAAGMFTQALFIVTRLGDSLQMAKNLFNLGICFDELRELDKAVYYLTRAVTTDPAAEDHHITAMAYNRLGKTQYHGKKYREAIVYYEKVLNYGKYRDTWENSFACQGLAEVYYSLGQYTRAVGYAEKAFAAAKELNAKWDAEQALLILAKSQAAAGDYRNAYKYQFLDQVYKDSLYSESKQEVENYFRLQAKEAANAALEKENKLIQEKVRLTLLLNVIISAFALTLVVAIILLYWSYKAKLRLNKELMEKNENISHLNQMKDQLFAVVSHDLRGPMASIQQTLQFASENALTEDEQKYILGGLSS
jgi:tetratricopeptide (TPR) repeat protein